MTELKPYSTKDLLTVREYEFRGIKVLVEIDRVNEKASLVEVDGKNVSSYTHKEWVFAERTVEYLKTWLIIYEAMKFATEAAIADLERTKEQKLKRTAELLMAVEDERNESE